MIRTLRLLIPAAFGLGTISSAFAQAEISCRLPSNDMIKAAAAICTKLGGSPVPAESPAGVALYGIWSASKRTEHDKAYAAAKSYVENFPQGGHARELQAWATAYETVMKSGLVRPAAPAPPQQAATPNPDPQAVELNFWHAIAASTDAANFEDYLRRYPEGAFAALAQRKIAALEQPSQPAPRPIRRQVKAKPTHHVEAPPLETVTIDGTTYVKGREPKILGTIPADPSAGGQ
jgi:hypothetical protein